MVFGNYFNFISAVKMKILNISKVDKTIPVHKRLIFLIVQCYATSVKILN